MAEILKRIVCGIILFASVNIYVGAKTLRGRRPVVILLLEYLDSR